MHPRPSKKVALVGALGCYAARDLFAQIALPPFDNSAMDGYAVVASSSPAGARLTVTGEQAAGLHRSFSIKPGEALRIFTGAPMPAGADAVVMQEDVSTEGDEILIKESVSAGEAVRRRGGDTAEGQKILSAGDRIRPQTIAILAAQGFSLVEVGSRARVALVSTGDELVAPENRLQPGQIYESNSVLLRALLQICGADVVSSKHCPDRAEDTEEALRSATTEADVVIISGGVSVGARDYVKNALASVGATLDLWRVRVKPGKPFLFAHTENCAIFGLPGNPISAFVTFLLLVRPAVLRLMGANQEASALPQTHARLAEEVWNGGDRPHYLRGILRGGIFAPVGRQESHALFGLSQSNALLRINPGERIATGAEAQVLTWE